MKSNNKTPNERNFISIKQGGMIKKSNRDLSCFQKRNEEFADKLSHLKSCKSISSKVLKQLSVLEDPTLETQIMLRIFGQLMNSFKKEKYRIENDIFEDLKKIKNKFLKAQATSLPGEICAVKAKIDRNQFDTMLVKKYAIL